MRTLFTIVLLALTPALTHAQTTPAAQPPAQSETQPDQTFPLRTQSNVVLVPTTVQTKQGAIIYVLPEVKTAQQVFGAFDVGDPRQVAAWQQQQQAARVAARDQALQKVSLQRPAR